MYKTTIDELTNNLREQGKRRAGGKPVCSLVSGGIDSAVATLLLIKAGFQVTGVHMIHHEADSPDSARALCEELGIDCLVIDIRREFRELVTEPFESAYGRGLTPNPCVTCNRDVKLGLLIERVEEKLNARDFVIATGHYARTGGGPPASLRRGVDPVKDQSYFLCMLPQGTIDRLLLPLGELKKSEVRELAEGLAAESGHIFSILNEKKESMEICFQPQGDYRRNYAKRGPAGEIADTAGRVLGRHYGIAAYTIGQRKGLGLASPEPLYVVGIDPDKNRVVVAGRELAFSRTVRAGEVNEIAPGLLGVSGGLTAKIRSQMKSAPCTVSMTDDVLTAVFDEPQFAPTPGQYLVVYSGDLLVAGGVIRADSDVSV